MIRSLTRVFRVQIHVKRVGKDLNQYRRELINGFMAGSREYLHGLAEATR